MKLAISNIGWDATKDIKVYELMKKHGYSGLEIAPTRIFSEAPYSKISEAKIWKENLRKEYGFNVPSMQSIWYGKTENIFSSEEERNILIEYTKKAIDFAVAIECNNLVFGCPKNRNVVNNAEIDKGIDFFKEIGDYAASKGTVVGMEANPPIYNTNYINDTLSALELIEKVESKGFKLNLDIGTMIYNNENVSELKGKAHLINHVHVSEPGLKLIEKRTVHQEINTILNREVYEGYVSIEMGKTDNLSDIENILEYVKECFGCE